MNQRTYAVGGFTLIEILIVIAITVSLSAVLLIYNRSTEKQIALYTEEATVVGVLNRAKALAIEKYHANVNSCAFGVHFSEPSSMTLFEDMKLPDSELGCRRIVSGEYKNDFFFDADTEAMETLLLDPRIRFSGLPPQGLNVIFIPPEVFVTSTVNVFPLVYHELPLTIRIETLDSSLSAIISVSATGQITVQ